MGVYTLTSTTAVQSTGARKVVAMEMVHTHTYMGRVRTL